MVLYDIVYHVDADLLDAGGDGGAVSGGGGGGGGRIRVVADDVLFSAITLLVDITGGVTRNASNVCEQGGAGTLCLILILILWDELRLPIDHCTDDAVADFMCRVIVCSISLLVLGVDLC